MKGLVIRKIEFSGVLSVMLLTSCFTGIENTGRISDKDVAKVHADEKTEEELFFGSVHPAAFSTWTHGKRFHVSDNNVRLILTPSVDSLRGHTLVYQGYELLRQIDNTEEALLVFSDNGKEYRYNTGKTLKELEETPAEYLVPFLTDLDFVSTVDGMLRGRTLYIKSSEWKTPAGETERGVRYVPVVVESVLPGDAVYPFYVTFAYGGKRAGVYMSSQTSSVKNMSFDKLFAFEDIRKSHKTVSDRNWELITAGKVAIGMTKEECTLSLGAPRSVGRTPTHGGLFERWVYVNGVYLMFENGLLVDFRQ